MLDIPGTAIGIFMALQKIGMGHPTHPAPDTFPGVVAILEKRLDIPGDLRVICHVLLLPL
jgi:hypothetical protein